MATAEGGDVRDEEDIAAAVAFDDEVVKGRAGLRVWCHVADDGETQPVVGHLLQQFTRDARTELEEVRVEPLRRHGDEGCALVEGGLDEVAGVAERVPGTVGDEATLAGEDGGGGHDGSSRQAIS